MKWTFVLFHRELSSSEIAARTEAANRKASSVPRRSWQVWQVPLGAYRLQPSSQRSRVSDSWQFLDQMGLQRKGQRVSRAVPYSQGLGAQGHLPHPPTSAHTCTGLGHLNLSGVHTFLQTSVLLGTHPSMDAGVSSVSACIVPASRRKATQLRHPSPVTLSSLTRPGHQGGTLAVGSFHLSVHLLHSVASVIPSPSSPSLGHLDCTSNLSP